MNNDENYNEAKILYDMYVATNSLKNTVYTDVGQNIDRIIVSGKTVTVFYKDNTTISYTGDS